MALFMESHVYIRIYIVKKLIIMLKKITIFDVGANIQEVLVFMHYSLPC